VRCVKALYGLITSSRDFVNSLSERILSFEDNGGRFKKMDTDHCIYVFTDKDGNEMILSHYVDDIICGSNNQELRNRLFKHLNQQWKITDEGVLNRFVGLNFERSEDGLTWEASCGPYIDKIAKRFKVDPKIQETPMDAGFAVMPEDLREEHSAEEMAAMETEFRSMIGSFGVCKRDDTLGHCLQRERALEISDEAKPKSHRCGSSRNSVFDDDARSEDPLDVGRGQSAGRQKK
jgi:hypothetical protein